MSIREKINRTSEPCSPYKSSLGSVPTLELRTPKESWVFPYTHFLHSCLNPSRELVITFATHQVVVSGRNLKRLQEHLTELSLKMIEPSDHFGLQPKDNAVVIETIRVVPIAGIEGTSSQE